MMTPVQLVIVDDNPMDRALSRMVINRLYKDNAIHIYEYDDGDSCWKDIIRRRTQPQVALIDHALSHKGLMKYGYQLAACIRQLPWLNTRIVYYSAHDPDYIQIALQPNELFFRKGAYGIERESMNLSKALSGLFV